MIGAPLTTAPGVVQMAGVMTCRTQGFRVCVVLGLAAALAGCATVQQHVGGWFGAATPTPTPTPTPRTKAAATVVPRVYYAGSDGLTVYKGPAASSKVVGTLSLHEKVTRTKLEGGFAYVESATGTKGWVNNTQLLRRVPTAAATAAPAAAPEPDPRGGAGDGTGARAGSPRGPGSGGAAGARGPRGDRRGRRATARAHARPGARIPDIAGDAARRRAIDLRRVLSRLQ